MAKVAFIPPIDTYVFNFETQELKKDDNQKRDSDCGELLLAQFTTTIRKSVIKSYQIKWQNSVLKNVKCFYAFTKHGNRIACVLINSCSNFKEEKAQKVIVYSHPNGEGKLRIQVSEISDYRNILSQISVQYACTCGD